MILPFLPLINSRQYLLACPHHYLTYCQYYWVNLLVVTSQNEHQLWNISHWVCFHSMVDHKTYCNYLSDPRICQIWSKCAKVLFVLSTRDRAISMKFATCNLVGGLGGMQREFIFQFNILFLHVFVIMRQMDLELNTPDINPRQTWTFYIISLYCGRFRR